SNQDQTSSSELNEDDDVIMTDSNDDSTVNTNDQTTDNKNSNPNKNLQQNSQLISTLSYNPFQ
ncbi:19071_t:CDS:1, partial [Racocetra fulgida]